MRISLVSETVQRGSANKHRQNCLWAQLDRHTTIELIGAVYPVLPLALQASQRHVCFEGNFWLWWTKKTVVIEYYAMVNKNCIPDR